jgi:hypothetical protein
VNIPRKAAKSDRNSEPKRIALVASLAIGEIIGTECLLTFVAGCAALRAGRREMHCGCRRCNLATASRPALDAMASGAGHSSFRQMPGMAESDAKSP